MDGSVKLNEDLYRKYKGVQEEWARSALENENFFLGKQWTASEINDLEARRQSPIVVNVVLPAVEQAVALLTTNRPRFSTTAREDSDIKVGKLFADILTYVWDISYGSVELKQVIKDYYVKGRGCMLAYFDPYGDNNKGEIMIKRIDPLEVYPDPNSRDIFCRDAAHILISQVYTEDEIARLYPSFDFEGAISTTTDDYREVQEYTHKKYRVIDRYTKGRVFEYHIYDGELQEEKVFNQEELMEWAESPAIVQTSQQGEEYLWTDAQVEQGMMLLQQVGEIFHLVQNPETGEPMPAPGEEGEGAIPGSTIQLQVVKKMNLIEAGIIPLREIVNNRVSRCLSIGEKLYWEGIVEGVEEYPIVFFMNRHKDSPYAISDVEVVKDLQKYVNKIRSLIVAHASNSTNVKILVNRGSVDKSQFESEWSKAGTAVLEVDMELGVPQVVQIPQLPNELYKNEADARKDIQEILGIYAMMQGDTSQAPNTYKGTIALDEYGQRRIRSKKDDIEASLNYMARVLIGMIQKYYTEYKAIRVIRPNNIEETVEINVPVDDLGGIVNKINDVTLGRYDAVVVSGSMLPSNRWAQFEYYVQMYQLGLIDQTEVLKKTEVVDIEGVLQRFDMIRQLQQQLGQAQEQIKKLDGDMQTMERENVHLKQQVEVHKFRSDLDGYKNRSDMATTLYQRRLEDELKMQKKIGANKQKAKR